MHERVIGNYFGMTFHMDTIYMILLTNAIVLVFAIVATRSLKVVPTSRWQIMLEIVVGALLEQAEGTMGAKGRRLLGPMFITLFLYLLFGNWLGLIPGFISPTSDINCTLGLALMIILLVNVIGVMNKGFVGHFSHFFKPHFIFLPINIIEEIAKPVTLAARLFGNIFAGEILLVILYMLVPYLIPTVWLAFSVFVGVVQALVFTIMSMSYIANALHDNH